MYRRSNLVYRVIDSFFRHRWMFGLAVLGVTATVSATLLLRSDGFAGRASTYVIADSMINGVAGAGSNQPAWVTPAQKNTNHLNDLLRDDQPGGFLDRALRSAKINNSIQIGPNTYNPRITLLRKSLAVFPEGDNTFTIGLNWNNAEECAKIIKSIQLTYIYTVAQETQSDSLSTQKFLNQKLEEYRNGMIRTEQILRDYRSKNLMTVDSSAIPAELENYNALKARFDDLLIDSQSASLRRQMTQKRLSQLPQTRVMEEVVGTSPTYARLTKIQNERFQLLAEGYQPQSKRVATLDGQVADLKRELVEEEKASRKLKRSGVNTIETRVAVDPEWLRLKDQLAEAQITERTHAAQMTNLRKQMADYETRLRMLPKAERDLTNKTRDYEFYKVRYAEMKKNLEDIRTATEAKLIAARAQLRPLGIVAVDSTSGLKKQLLMVLASLILGVVVGTILVVLKEWLDPTFRYEMDAERMLGVPVLMGLPETGSVLALPGSSHALRRPDSFYG